MYRTYNMHQVPFVALNVQVPAGAFDVNVTPDKRTVFVHHERELLEHLRVRHQARGRGIRGAAAIDPPGFLPALIRVRFVVRPTWRRSSSRRAPALPCRPTTARWTTT